ncbi:MAG: ribosome maturation factor RimP [Desulfobacterales bacterium]|nr:ribosome maturation factor RimP [Desulfobacterales bacterium]
MAEGMELIQVAYQRESAGRVLRLYIDKPGGVTLKDCADISRQVADLLDVSLDDVGPYGLEVSSPGVERPLVRVSDFERFKDRRARIQMDSPIDGRKAFTGILLGMTEDRVHLCVDNRTVALPYDGIAKAHLVAEPLG